MQRIPLHDNLYNVFVLQYTQPGVLEKANKQFLFSIINYFQLDLTVIFRTIFGAILSLVVG